MDIRLNIENALGCITKEQIEKMLPEGTAALETVEKGTGAGNDYLGWVKLPSETTPELIADINKLSLIHI